jgi:Family of unknown function (DUF6982)
MTDIQDTSSELRELDEKLREAGLTPEEQARREQLRADAGMEPLSEGTTGILWEDGPVEEPADPLPDLVTGSPAELAGWEAPATVADPVPPPLPPPDPSFAAVVVEKPEEVIPEVGDEDVEEIVEAVDAPVAIATVSWVDEEGPVGEAVSLDALLATPPPANAESLAPPLPPPLPSGVAAFHPVPPGPPLQAGPDPFAPSPSFISGDHRVVLHTVEGQVLRGSLANADLGDVELPLLQPNGAVARIPAAQVKAIFFMLPAGERPPAAAGTRLRVVFGDGRQISGLSPDYSAGTSGFFVLPLDSRTNTARVWVYRAAVRQLNVG